MTMLLLAILIQLRLLEPYHTCASATTSAERRQFRREQRALALQQEREAFAKQKAAAYERWLADRKIPAPRWSVWLWRILFLPLIAASLLGLVGAAIDGLLTL